MKPGNWVYSLSDAVIDKGCNKQIRLTVFALQYPAPAGADHIFSLLVANTVFYIVLLFFSVEHRSDVRPIVGAVIRVDILHPNGGVIINELAGQTEIIYRRLGPAGNVGSQISHSKIVPAACSGKGIEDAVGQAGNIQLLPVRRKVGFFTLHVSLVLIHKIVGYPQHIAQ